MITSINKIAYASLYYIFIGLSEKNDILLLRTLSYVFAIVNSLGMIKSHQQSKTYMFPQDQEDLLLYFSISLFIY